MPKCLDIYGDSDWADEERKRSTTGVTEIFGGHPLDAASATQSLIALSGAEAEFYACNRGTAGGLQTRRVTRLFHESGASAVLATQSPAVARRQGTGRLRHLEIRHMWTRTAAEGRVPAEVCSHGRERGGPDDEASCGRSV